MIPPGREIALVVEDAHVGCAVTVDGQLYVELRDGDRIVIRRGDVPCRLVVTGIRSYYRTLREKLNWQGHPNYGRSPDQ